MGGIYSENIGGLGGEGEKKWIVIGIFKFISCKHIIKFKKIYLKL